MRKILTSVLAVAGLLAVVLALASSPASAARRVITVNTPVNAGTYTVSWETNGGCDPGDGTSGASGSAMITVAATNAGSATDTDGDGTPDVLALTGTVGTDFITVNDDCTYSLSATLVEASVKAVCALTGLPPTNDADGLPDDADGVIDLMVGTADAACAPSGKIVVNVNDASRNEIQGQVVCTAVQIADTGNTDCNAAGDMTTGVVRVDKDGVTEGAIGTIATFEVSATPVPNSNDQCQPATDETSKNRAGVVTASLNVTGNQAVVDGDLTPVNCRYDVEIHLPPGFTGTSSETHKVKEVEANGGDAGASVAVATRNVYLIQNVDGDSDGGYVTYRFTTAATPDAATARCVAGLPGSLDPVTSGGIVTSTTVELREGRFNINAAVNNGQFAPVAAFAMDHKAVPCYASATVRNLPDHCSAENPTNAMSANLVTDADGDGNVLVEHVITCVEPAVEEPAADDMGGDDTGTDDTGADDMGTDDMGTDDMGTDDTGADDMGADDMGADDMGTGDTGGEEMGPPSDVPTG